MKVQMQYFPFHRPSLLSTICIVVGIFILTLSVPSHSYAQTPIAPEQIREIAWSPKGDNVAFSYETGQITIASMNGEQPSLNLGGHTGPVFTRAWSPNGDFLASGGANPDNSLRIWDATNGQEVFTRPAASDFNSPTGFVGRLVEIHLDWRERLVIPVGKPVFYILF